MRALDRKPLYQHIDVALLRAAAAPLTNAPDEWPDLTDTAACREWLGQAWSRPDLAEAVRQASPSLGDSVEAIRAGHTVGDKQIRGATLSTARYLLRSVSRPTPFGLFAGVAPVTLARTAQACWGENHRGVTRVNTGWLADIVARAEGCPELLELFRRTVLSPAQWRLATDDLPPGQADQDRWQQVLDRWRRRWGCPDVVELRDADRTLRLILDEPAHAALLYAHLKWHGQAILHEVTPAAEYGWIDGHAHEVALPLVTTRAAAPNPLRGSLPEVTNTHGHLPGSLEATWVSVKVYTPPERMTEIIAGHLPRLLAALDPEPSCWWLRYHSPQETDHLRLRIRTDPGYYAACTNAVGEWAPGRHRRGARSTRDTPVGAALRQDRRGDRR